jgi:histidine triad (HIT) family protein
MVAAGGTPAKILGEDELVLAVDVPEDHPVKRAPVHFLVIPRRHLASARELHGSDGAMLAAMIEMACTVAERMGIGESGYRLATNTGPHANQTEFHMHLHCIGGRPLGAEG